MKNDNSDSSLLVALKKLNDAIAKDVPGATIEVVDLYLAYNHMFSPAAKKAMANKVTSLNPSRKFGLSVIEDKVEYFSAIAVGQEKIVKAARIIAEYINKLAAKGYVTGCLAPISTVRLHTEFFELDRYAVFCFVSLTLDGSKIVQEENPSVRSKEGELSSKVVA